MLKDFKTILALAATGHLQHNFYTNKLIALLVMVKKTPSEKKLQLTFCSNE